MLILDMQRCQLIGCKLVFLGSSSCYYRAGQKVGLEHVMIFELWTLLVGGTYKITNLCVYHIQSLSSTLSIVSCARDVGSLTWINNTKR